MSALMIRRQLRRQRRNLAVIAAGLTLAGAIAAHHSGGLMDMHQDTGIGAIVELCLGVFTAVGVVLVAVGLRVVALRWPRAPIALAAGAMRALGAPGARARHGPAAVAVLCVSRR
ncbi:MAG: hypothetical protein LC790_06975 [Actinobacteria bacterium]|nr:hypothetical protein [Actinomycetota bacterium]